MELEANSALGGNTGHDNRAADNVAGAIKAPSPAPSPAHAAAVLGTLMTIPANATRISAEDGIVRLPVGTRLDAIKISGPDLLIALPDGHVMVIVGGALHIPQIAIGPINIPGPTIAALIAGQEPEPAAGAPQSSGGNFIETPGDIGDPFALGDLLPPTEFGFAPLEARTFIPAAVDNKPEILIVSPDQPLGSTTATATVFEAALPARATEPAGSDPLSNAETVMGTIQINSIDGPSVIAVNGIPITAIGQIVTTPLGVFTVTSIAPDTIGYTYTLIDNSINPSATETVTITVTDGDGDVATATLTVVITDDAPTARADTDTVAPNTYTAQTGNVISGIGTTSGAVGADTLGADGATLTGIRSTTAGVFSVAGTPIAGLYGRLLMNADGSYSYVRSAGSPGGVADIFTYQLTDGDGDTATATLTINIGDSAVGLVVPSAGDDGTLVDEAGLGERVGETPGSRDGDDSNVTAGVINFDVHDGPAIITINGILVTGEGQEIILPTGTLFVIAVNPDSLEYYFILTDNVIGAPTSQPIAVTVTDQDGDTASSSFVIEIRDDAPTAVADTDRIAAGSYGPATGNVITDVEGDGGQDTRGADGASVTQVTGAGGAGAPGTGVVGLYGILTLNADGSYSYIRNPGSAGGVSDVFTYALTDGDGDTSNATLTIAIGDSGVLIRVPSGADAGQIVTEAGLPAGSAPSSGGATTSGAFTVSIPDGPGQVAINGVTVTSIGQTISGNFGMLTITSISATTIGYSYTLMTATNGDTVVDPFNIRIVDADGDIANGILRINITDDVPTARDDVDTVQAGNASSADGNVITGIGGSDANNSDGHADVQGADRATVTSVTFAGDSGFVGGTTPGDYGILTIAADGSYRYTLDNLNSEVRGLNGDESLTETFEYTISDGDGDESTATLTVTIHGQNDVVTLTGLNAPDGEVTVSEANLSDGSAPNSDALTRTGSFTFDAADGIASIVIGGVALYDGDIVPGVTITNDHGILTITGFDAVFDVTGDIIGGTIRYSYELTDNSLGHIGANGTALTETFTVTIVDSDGTVATSGIDVIIVDDSPLALADQGTVGEGQMLEASAAIGLLANDILGADEATILGVRALGSDPVSPASNGVGSGIAGLYGTLTIAADGSYIYTSNPDVVAPSGTSDVFIYSLRDSDGDISTTTLTIHVTDSGLSATHLGITVNEAALPGASNPASPDESVSGDLGANVTGGTGPFDFALSGNGIGNHGTITLNADGTYTYILASAVHGVIANNGINTVPNVETFTYTVTDAFGNTAQNTITIDVVDDVPTARAAPAINVAEDAAAISGNMLANDTLGADGAVVTSINVGGINVSVLATGTTSYSNAAGTYTFQPNGAWTFDPVPASSAVAINAGFAYTMTDGDGDQSTAQQIIRVTDGAGPRAGAPVTLTLDDQNLESGSTPSIFQPVSVNGQIVFTAGSDPVSSIVFGDTSGLDGGLVWTRDSDNQITGWDTDIPVVTLILTVTGLTATIQAILESNYAHHSDTTADDLAQLGFANVVATDSDGTRAVGTVNIAVSDDVPTITALSPVAGMLTVDETNLAMNATANFATLFNVVMGADQPGTVTYAFDVTTASGLFDVATGAKIILLSLGNIVEGRLAGAPSIVAFRLTIAADGHATLDQIRAIQHGDPNNPDDGVTMSSTIIRLTATVTDGDGDQASATAYVGGALIFRDDGPAIDASAVDTNTILLVTQDGDTRGAAFDVAIADLSSAFSVASSSYGADGMSGTGQILWSYALALGSAAASSGLSSNGALITLTLAAGTVIGSADGSTIFTVSVNTGTGIVTLTQFAEIDHPLPGAISNYPTQLVELAVNLIELRGTATIFDRDGDSSSDTVAVDLGGNIRFADDGPTVSGGGTAPMLVVDETNFNTNATADLSGIFAATLDFGADGAGSVAYALGITAGPSGLIDSLSGEAIILSLVGGVVYGRTSAHEAFRISIGADGVATFDQSRAILHSPDSGPDQMRVLLGTNLVTLTAIVTDGDGDTARSTVDITGHFAIRDDAPLAVNDVDNVARDGQTFADGNVLTGVGGTDDNGTDGSPDNPGADGGLRVSGVAFGAHIGILGSALAGEYGTLILSADGSYRYQVDIADPAVIALNANQTLAETFQYTVQDADGDTSTATITISITGANDFPIARADTNWVLDGASGSDPSAMGNVLQDIAHPGAPSGSFADVADNDPDLEPITVTSAGTFAGVYGTLIIGANGAYTYTLNEDNAAVNALDTGQTLIDNFSYTISDGLLSVGSQLSITVFGTNDAPTIGTSIARISEEGLLGGNPDTAPNALLDTTNSTSFSGVVAIGDLDAGETLNVSLGNPGAVLSAGGVAVTWAGIGTGTLIGSAGGAEVIRVTLAPNGAYTVTLSHGVDHPNVTLEDLKEFNVPVSVSDGTVTTINPAAIHIIIEDDAPIATGETGSSTQPLQDINTLFILDFSDSIDSGELNIMLGAVQNALTQLDSAASGTLGIRFVIFSSGSFASPSFTTAAAANLYLDSLNPSVAGGVRPTTIGLNTNYTSAIQTALANFSAVPGASNQVFFLSDGNPNSQVQFAGFPPSVVNSLIPATATAWNNFVDNNHVNVTAIGIDNNPLQPLNIQRLADVDLNDAPNNQPILVTNFQALVATLLAVIVPVAVGGDLDANDAYGADGGHIFSITIGAITYTYDGTASIAVSSGGTIAGHNLTAIVTPMGGTLTLDFATGQYNYQPPSPITVTAIEAFSYTLIDGDGDTASATLSVTITAAAPPVVIDLDGDGVEFVSSAAGVLFDYNGDGIAESTAWVGADDGLLVIDNNGDGRITDGSELIFGHGGLSDLQGLAAAYDSNNDGVLDATDTAFARFGIWQDANSNGVTDAGEFQTLTDAGIVSISLVTDGRSYTAADGQVIVHGETIFTRVDGSTGRVADASFATNFANDPYRAVAAAAATNGLSAALVAAGLIASAPLMANPLDQSASDGHNMLGDVLDLTPSMISAESAPLVLAPVAALDIAQAHSGLDTAQNAENMSGRHAFWDIHDPYGDTRATGVDLSANDKGFTKLLDHADAMPAPAAMPHIAFPSAGGGVQAIATPAQSEATSANAVNGIVADALEGQSIDLDALLGAEIAPESILPHIQFQAFATVEFAPGNLFMPDMAEHQIIAQMEHAAATGHL